MSSLPWYSTLSKHTRYIHRYPNDWQLMMPQKMTRLSWPHLAQSIQTDHMATHSSADTYSRCWGEPSDPHSLRCCGPAWKIACASMDWYVTEYDWYVIRQGQYFCCLNWKSGLWTNLGPWSLKESGLVTAELVVVVLLNAMLMLQMQIKWVEISRNQKIIVIQIFQFWAMNLYKLLNIIIIIMMMMSTTTILLKHLIKNIVMNIFFYKAATVYFLTEKLFFCTLKGHFRKETPM